MEETARATKLDHVLSKLQGVRPLQRSPNKYMARCPIHNDAEPSLCISIDEDGRIGVHCFAGCTPQKDPHRLDRFLETTGLTWADLQPEKDAAGHASAGSAYERLKAEQARRQARQGGEPDTGELSDDEPDITLIDLCEAKKLSIHLLDNLYVEDGFKWGKRRVIRIPYFTEGGEEHTRFRVRLSIDKGKKRFSWGGPSGVAPIAYGLNFLSEARAQKRLIICEGETDVWTLAMFHYAAIGLPGAEHMDKLQDRYLDGVEEVFIIDEQDGGGAAFVRGLRQRLLIDLEYKGVVKVVQLRSLYSTKDPNELHCKLIDEKRPEFRAQFDAALDAAIRIQDWRDPDQDDTIPRLVSAAFVMNLPSVPFLINGLVPAQSLGMILGKENTGKSFLAVDWACSIATGQAWNGRAVKQGKVIYVASEGLVGYKNRLKAWLQHNGKEYLEALAANLDYVEGTIDLMDTERRQQLIDAIAGASTPPALVIIDTLAESMPGGDENSSRDMGVILETSRHIRKQIGAAVLAVHHKPKSGEGSRGHSSLPGAVDVRYEVDADADDSTLVTVTCTKARDFDKSDLVMLFRREKILLEGAESEYDSSCVLVPTEREPSAHAFANETQEKMYSILEALGHTTSNQFRERCVEVGISNGSFYRHVKAMVDAGLIVQEGTGGRGQKTYYYVAPTDDA